MSAHPTTIKIGHEDQGTLRGTDVAGDSVPIGVTGPNQDSIKVTDEHTHLLGAILTELRIGNRYLEEIYGNGMVTADDVDGQE